MTEQLKKRLIGAAVLVSLAVIFIPILVEDERPSQGIVSSNIPASPPIQHQQQFLPEKKIEDNRKAIEFGNSIVPSNNADVVELKTTQQQQEKATTKVTPLKTRVGLTGWMIQAGSFSSRENAEKLVRKLRDAGFDTHLESAQVKKLKVYRVRVGPEIDKSNADKMAKQISKKFFVSAKVIQYP